jgi:hypothetical protein
MSIPTVLEEKPCYVRYYFPRELYKEFKKTLFENGLTSQEFIFYIIYLVALNDNKINILINEAKTMKNEGKLSAIKTMVKTSASTIYHMINEHATFK